MQAAVGNKIEKIQRKFLWGDTEEKRKLHLIGWDKLTRKKKYGGIGIKRLMEQNTALLAKGWWRFNKEKDALWVKLVSSKLIEAVVLSTPIFWRANSTSWLVVSAAAELAEVVALSAPILWGLCALHSW
ncbi:hypothetical protein RHMOL_Rhmol04G0228000 [Rhododendron molle]|uniref:Uncharacterized protein n=1 Tax=Rhododendron molle TaxID=49168 RepID=A0ACC0P526_RHOML|nr:hypothetical protein RHMOL_Rhmol04G0228000 [Rhododendron molle]